MSSGFVAGPTAAPGQHRRLIDMQVDGAGGALAHLVPVVVEPRLPATTGHDVEGTLPRPGC